MTDQATRTVEETGWQINGRLYPFVTSFRLGDPVLVEALTGLSWVEFVDRLPDDDVDEQPDDPVVNLGLIGVAVAQVHTTWRRDRVVQYVTGLPMETVEWVGAEEPPEAEPGDEDEGDAGAPAIPFGPTSPTSPPTLTPGSQTTSPGEDQESEGSNPQSSGGLTSVM